MECNNCSVTELKFDIRLEGETNLSFMSNVIRHLERRGLEITRKEDRLLMKEAGAQEFFDFCLHHMEPTQVQFRIDKGKWNALEVMEQIFSTEWIDEVIRKELLVCHYQPIVTADEGIFAYEMLARFHREDGTVIYPNEIFPAAKSRSRLYALDRVCRMAAVRHAAVLKDVKAFINFIPTSIYSPEFCLRSTTNLANELGVDPRQLVFEVVETEKVDDIEHLREILAFYKKKGFQYALDDVGEGYSTIELLSDLQPHYMKLDMQFVQGIATDENKQQTAMRFLEKAIEIGSVPLAEGIETKEDFEWLKQLGYQLFQGYYFGKPAKEPMRIVPI